MTAEDDRLKLEAAKEVRIATRAADGTVHRTIIWVVVEDGRIYIRSVNGATARWHREAVARPDVALHVHGRRLLFRAVPATDASSIAACSAGLERKYKRSYSVRAMVAPSVLGTTLRLDPA
jgi:hypothetical protein